MVKQKIQFSNVKTSIESNLGKPVKVLVNLGRNKFAQFDGIVTNCYPALFTVSPTQPFNGKTSFSYSEVMCGTVKVQSQTN